MILTRLWLSVILIILATFTLQAQCEINTATNSTGCSGGVTSLSATTFNASGYNTFEHRWYTDASLTNRITISNQGPPFAGSSAWVSRLDNFSENTTYYVVAVCDNVISEVVEVGYSTETDPITISTSGRNPNDVCEGDNSFVLTAKNTSASGGYVWEFDNGSGRQAITESDSTLVPEEGSGTYYVTANNICGPQQTASIAVTFFPTLGALSGPSNTTVCQGDTTTFTASAANADFYTWQITGANIDTDYSIISQTALGDTIVIAWEPSYSGIASTTLRAFGCASTSRFETFNVTVNAPPPATITPMGTTVIPLGSNSVSLAANSGEGLSYQWYLDESPLPGETDRIFKAFMAGSYTVAVTQNGCTTLSSPTVVTTANNYNYVIARTIRVKEKSGGNPITEDDLPTLSSTQKNEVISYLDGLGRPMQTVSWQSSPDTSDQVSPVYYDNRGRQSRQYLPYTGGDNGYYQPTALTAVESFYQNPSNPSNGIVTDNLPYARTIFEASPLSRIEEQGAPGSAFQPEQGHGITYEYPTNQAGQIKRWSINSSELPFQNATYPAGMLTITTSFDEDDRQNVVYTDKLGRTVLKRTLADSTTSDFLDTYYIYDDYNRLSFVLPPECSDQYSAANQVTLDSLGFQYRYDERGNMTHKKVPGADWQYMIYDHRDRMILSQDGRQRALKEWSFTHYDALNRPIVQGTYFNSNDTTYALMRVAVESYLTSNENNAEPISKDSAAYQAHGANLTLSQYNGEHLITASTSITLTTGFSVKNLSGETVTLKLAPSAAASPDNSAFPALEDCEVLQLIHYDHYDFDGNGTSDYAYDATGIDSGADITLFSQARGKQTGSTVKVLSSGLWLTSALFYDDKGRVIQTQSDNHLGGRDIVTSEYSFHGLVLRQWHRHSSDSRRGSENFAVLTRHAYDQADRLTHVYQKIGSGTEQLLAQYQYNALGELIDKGLHQTSPDNFFQSVDFRYNIRGWLTSINQTDLAEQSVNGTINAPEDLFGQEFGYENQLSGLNVPGLYNGNISAVVWGKDDNVITPGEEKAYTYQYDLVNRLTDANYFSHDGSNWNSPGQYNVRGLAYDKNGNLTHLNRLGADGTMMDSLSYAYRGNQLTAVSDLGVDTLGFVNGSNVAEEYYYDQSSNLIQDLNKEIEITYNHLNLPELIRFAGGNQIRYYYDASGTKLQKEVNTNSRTETDYVTGIQYQQRALDFITHAEGRSKRITGGYEHHYDLKDHLGNVRVTFSNQPVVTSFAATMETGGESAAREMQYFDNIEESRQTLAYHNATSASSEEPHPNKVATLNAAKGRTKGPAKSMLVHKGDIVHIEVKASYEEHSRKPLKADGAIAAVIGSLSAPQAGLEASSAYKSLSEFLSGATLLDDDEDGLPKAYLNYIVMDTAKRIIDQGFVQLSKAAEVKMGKPKNDKDDALAAASAPQAEHETLAVDLDIQESGYLYTYVTNESNWDVDVHFDDVVIFAVGQQPTVIQSDDFYPYGLSFNQSAVRVLENKYLYQGKEWQDELGLGVYDFDARGYDPALGRTWQHDPHADGYYEWAPYSWVGNNPISNIDPDGRDWYKDQDGNEILIWGVTGDVEGYEWVREDNSAYLLEEATVFAVSDEKSFDASTPSRHKLLSQGFGDMMEEAGKLWLKLNTPYQEANYDPVTYYGGTPFIPGIGKVSSNPLKLLTVGPTEKMHKHHIFNVFRGNSPQSAKYRAFFKKHGINVDDHTVLIPKSLHKYIHRSGKNWTTEWRTWIDNNPNATAKDVYQQAGKMMEEYGINYLPIIPYK